jgi:hypothetical protein
MTRWQRGSSDLTIAEQRIQFGGSGVNKEQCEGPYLDGKELMPWEVKFRVFGDAAEPATAFADGQTASPIHASR